MSIIDQFHAIFEKDIYRAFGPKKYGPWFRGMNYLHIQEQRMSELLEGRNGIPEMRKKVESLRAKYTSS